MVKTEIVEMGRLAKTIQSPLAIPIHGNESSDQTDLTNHAACLISLVVWLLAAHIGEGGSVAFLNYKFRCFQMY